MHESGTDSAPGRNVSHAPPPSNPSCPQGSLDSSVAPVTRSYIYPRSPIVPFYQWENNDGYCGEVSLLQAGLNNGQWMSQLEARSVCGAQGDGQDAPLGVSLSQSGPDGFCAAQHQTDYNAQLLLENEASANAASCLSNARLAYRTYDYSTDNIGMPGYRNYMSWVKAETLAGRQVTVGVLVPGGGDTQYDHIVTVMAIGTNHEPADPTYYDDDVLFFDDHGALNAFGWPAVPPGAGGSHGCVPYVFGYAFGALAKSRQGADMGPNFFAILIPGHKNAKVYTGGNGVGFGPSVTAHNYGFSVGGPADSDGSTLPVTVHIAGSSTGGVPNPADPVAGYDYENPFIGTSDQRSSCTNAAPNPMRVTLEVTVSGLVAGSRYNLYEYDVGPVTGTGAAAALAVPTSSFNGKAKMATRVTPILAHGSTFVSRVEKSSRETIVFRAVPVGAP